MMGRGQLVEFSVSY